jgi:hypothetical protein
LLVSSLSYAEKIETPLSAMHLYTACKAAETSGYAGGFCDGAIDALYSSMDEACVPHSVTHGEVREQVMKELLRSVPEFSYDALEFVKTAVYLKWPCP